MILKKLQLSDFRCFSEAQVQFKPFTLLTGANSSGKSSLIYSLLCIMQSLSASRHVYPFSIAPNGDFCNLGSYREMVRGQDERRSIGIGITLEYPKNEIHMKSSLHFSREYQEIVAKDISVNDKSMSLKKLLRLPRTVLR
jgi:predicted ATPase